MLPGWKLCIRDQYKHKHDHDLLNTRTRLSFCSWVLCPLCFGGALAAQGSRGQPPWLPPRRLGRRLRPSSVAQMPSAPSGACAVLASNLQVKGLATGQPPTPAFFRVLVESGERVAEFCAKSVRVHGIKFLENKCLVLKCEPVRE